jgi:NAD(P)-dependent dehydrogenase (short-subunit alcohol dehydrogenase family)
MSTLPFPFGLDGQVAIVTGGGTGIGEATTRLLASVGADVVISSRKVENLDRVASEVAAETGRRIVAVQGDVRDEKSCQEIVDRTIDEFGRVDILVNSAGSAFRSPAEEFPEDRFDFIVNLNLKGTYLCCQAFGRKMLARGSCSIINLGSIGSFIGYPWASAYLASKGGVLGITRGLALEWRDRGVRVNAIGPTLMDSPLTRQAAQRTSLTADFIKARMLRQRLGLPRELIGAAIFLASDGAELVTGHTLMCDDGYLSA